MNSKDIYYSGLLRPISNFERITSFKKISKNKIKVLLISEQLTSALEITPYLQSLLKHDDIDVAIKVRPMIKDIYYEEMKVVFPEIRNLKLYDGKIEEEGKEFDVFIGSMSTAIIEGSLFGKISVLLNTLKFGDYYDIDSLIPGRSLLVRDPELLYEHIIDRVNNEHSLNTIEIIRKRFFGGNKDGAQWIVEQL